MSDSSSTTSSTGEPPLASSTPAHDARSDTPPRRRGVPWMPWAVAGVVLIAFAPVWNAGFVNWDDDQNLLNNGLFRGFSLPHVRWMFSTFHGGHYQPLSWLTLAVDYTFWGMQPRGYHLTNLFLHTVNALLVYALAVATLPRAARAPGGGMRLSIAAAVAALGFAIHPLRVESVAWVTERRDVLSGCFFLLTVLAYVRMADAPQAHSRRRWYALALGSFILSLLSKAWGMTLPVVLLVLDAYPLQRFTAGREPLRRILLEKLPFVVLAGAAMVLAAMAQMTVGEMRTLGQHGLPARVTQAAYGLLFYLGKTLLPINLSPLYPLRPDFDPTALPYILGGCAVMAITLLLLWVRRRWPWALAAWVCYGVILSPVLGFLQTGPQLVADRYTYLACLPWALLASAAVYQLPSGGRRAGTGVAAALLLALATLTFRQAAVWTDAVTLWDHALRIDPSNYVANVNRGWLQLQHEDFDGALAYYEAALRANPRFAIAYRSRGFVRQRRGDLRGAIADYTTSIQLEPHSVSYFNRGLAWHALGEADAALADYNEALRLNGTNPQAFNNRGMLRRDRGDVAGAISDFQAALAVAPPDWPYRAQAEANLKDTQAQAGGK